jgi:hypothetical protein
MTKDEWIVVGLVFLGLVLFETFPKILNALRSRREGNKNVSKDTKKL